MVDLSDLFCIVWTALSFETSAGFSDYTATKWNRCWCLRQKCWDPCHNSMGRSQVCSKRRVRASATDSGHWRALELTFLQGRSQQWSKHFLCSPWKSTVVHVCVSVRVQPAPRCWHGVLLKVLVADAKRICWPRCSLWQNEGVRVCICVCVCIYICIYTHTYARVCMLAT